jgi:excisionase family DNA binding protein
MSAVATKPDQLLTPPAIAERLGVKPDKVLIWIRTGELVATNLATSTAGRPRFRISREALADFLHRREVLPPRRAKRRQKQKRPAGYVEYYPE